MKSDKEKITELEKKVEELILVKDKKQEERYKAEKEIELWVKHLDVDEFHYNRSRLNFIAILTLLIALFIGLISLVISLAKIDSLMLLIHVNIIMLIGWIIFILIRYYEQIRKYKGGVTQRINMVDDLYKNLDVDKDDKLKKEFEMKSR